MSGEMTFAKFHIKVVKVIKDNITPEVRIDGNRYIRFYYGDSRFCVQVYKETAFNIDLWGLVMDREHPTNFGEWGSDRTGDQ